MRKEEEVEEQHQEEMQQHRRRLLDLWKRVPKIFEEVSIGVLLVLLLTLPLTCQSERHRPRRGGQLWKLA